MATNRRSIDTDVIVLRTIYARTAVNQFIPNRHILISNGRGLAYWNSISSIFPISTINAVRGTNQSTYYADHFNNILNVSTVGPQGLLESLIDPATSTLTFYNQPPTTVISQQPVPNVSRNVASNLPFPETITMSTGQTAVKFAGVRDIQFSTVADLRTVFVGISTFTSQGYLDLSAETRAWRPYVYSTNSTSAGYATFVSTLPISTNTWNWSTFLSSNLPLSTVDAKPYFSTGDAYFSTVTINMDHFIQYINPNLTTKMFLEVQPNYFFPRFYFGADPYQTLFKPISTFVQYETARTGPLLISTSQFSDTIISQQSNAYTSNFYNRPFKIEIDTATVLSNYAADGSAGYYTLYHYMPGAIANLIPQEGCATAIGPRGGISNLSPVYDNRSSRSNGAFLHIYNQNASAPPYFNLGS